MPQPGYLAPPPPNTREHANGTAVLVLGLMGLIFFWPLCIIAWIMGSSARKEMKAQPDVVWTNSATVTAGWILGMIGTLLLLALISVLMVTIVAFAGAN